MHLLLWPLMLIAGTGLVLSLLLHVQTLTRMPVPELRLPWCEEYSQLLTAGIFGAWFPAVLLAHRMHSGGRQHFSWKTVLAGCPDWMRYGVHGLLGYAFLNFFPAITDGQTARAFSGHGMLFYGIALCIYFSTWRRPRLLQTRQCPLGHKVQHTDHSCPECGSTLADEKPPYQV